MGKMVEKKRRKKKGRPSLLDLQKRNLKLQQQQHQQRQQTSNSTPNSTPNYSSTTPTSIRRSTRRTPNPGIDKEDEDSSGNKRRRKKLKLVHKLPPDQKSDNSDPEEEIQESSNHKKRRIKEIRDGSGAVDEVKEEEEEEEEEPMQGEKSADTHQENQLHSGGLMPLPDKKLLLFILDRLQKKDTYGVFSEPVDPEELPDYHEVIEHPMDFGTIRKKLASGAYANLGQFEKDVFLICSNAMEYNASDTIYFRQARSIQELAKKNFENLRQDNDSNGPGRKIVRRGRPPTKNLKKIQGRPSSDRTGLEFSSDANVAAVGENTALSNLDLIKGQSYTDKSEPLNLSGKFYQGIHNHCVNAGWSVEKRSDKNYDLAGSSVKGNVMRNWKKQPVLKEQRRNTYKLFHMSTSGCERSVLATFSAERKFLMAVGLHSDHGYARSLARFATNLGPVAWKVASKRIERSLPAGAKYGPGWVGENDIPPQRWLQLCLLSRGESSLKLFGLPEIKENLEHERENSHEKHASSVSQATQGQPNNVVHSASSVAPLVNSNESTEPQIWKVEANGGVNSSFEPKSSCNSLTTLQPTSQIHQSPNSTRINGLNGTYCFNIAAQTGKLVVAADQSAGVNLPSPRSIKPIFRKAINGGTSGNNGCSNLEEHKTLEQNVGSGMSSSDATPESLPNPIEGNSQPPSELSQQKTDSELSSQQHAKDTIPPDLNVRFRSPRSPSSSRVSSAQPDLALQL